MLLLWTLEKLSKRNWPKLICSKRAAPDKSSFHPSSWPLLWFSVLGHHFKIHFIKRFLHFLLIQRIKRLCNLHFVQTRVVRNVNICLDNSKESCHLWIKDYIKTIKIYFLPWFNWPCCQCILYSIFYVMVLLFIFRWLLKFLRHTHVCTPPEQ